MQEVPQETRDQFFKEFLAEPLDISRLSNIPYLGPRIERILTWNNIRTFRDLKELLNSNILVTGRTLYNLPAHGQRTIDELYRTYCMGYDRHVVDRVLELEKKLKEGQKKGDVIPEGFLSDFEKRLSALETTKEAVVAGIALTKELLQPGSPTVN